ncbi:MAG: CHAT domain-containing protein [Okeania sp. SIO3I5]|uniref:CHAT domain-containing protein n=1 Tax=Okeania sp. SIO3I5 TaxID=2607805 RepID=UPI0013B5B4F8|nr:CHAT domain-containing protein [Okeania sp. SIO3I5]NEQ39601.1 CHAT domain-containing protein [Okeania sp. SIO3I5]
MKANKLESCSLTALSLILGTLAAAPPTNSQPITPANDGTGTTINQNGNQFNIEGGTRSGANLFHSFDKFNVPTNQTANFLTTPDTRNILGRVTGGNASYVNGLIQVIGGNSNLFLMNPAGIIFGQNATLNIPASFSVTTATGIGFDNNNFWFQAMGTNDYSNLVGNHSGYRFNVSNPGAIVNEGNLTLNPGENLTLLGGIVINTGELSTAGGNITIAAVEGESILRISQPGHLLSLDVGTLHGTSLENGDDISGITSITLPTLLTGGEETHASSVIVNANGDVVLTDSNTLVAHTPGIAITSGNIDVSTTSTSHTSHTSHTPHTPHTSHTSHTSHTPHTSFQEGYNIGGQVNVLGDRNVSHPPNPPYQGGDISSLPLSKGDGRGIGGQVNVLGDRVALIDTNINADGVNGGGQVLIGGYFQGNGIVPNSQQTFINNNSIISADAINNGDGGRVIVWSDGITNFAGNISAQGGQFSGNGGFVEVSGKQQLIFDGTVNVSAAFGTPGTILLDPENVIVGEDNSETESKAEGDNSEVSATENSENSDAETEGDNSEVSATENSENSDAETEGDNSEVSTTENSENLDSETETEGNNSEVSATENLETTEIADNSETETVENNSEVPSTENTDSPTTEIADNSETTPTETPIDPFAQNENSDVTISAENLGELSGDVILLADNDITINEKIETDSSVELKAGRSININADIDTSVGNGNIDLFGNNDEMNLANRSNGKASINQLDGTTLNAGSGRINIELGNLGEVGDINLGSLTTTGEVFVNANGGNIARVSSNSLINAGSVLFQTSGTGGIGLTDAPLQLDVENLEAVSGSGGVFFDVGNVNIGDVSEDVNGIATAGGDIDIKSDGNVTLTESISTIETVENNSEAEISSPSQGGLGGSEVENNSEAEISPPSEGGLGGSEAVEPTENTEVTDTNGAINIEATGDIVATGSGIKGGGENVSLSATNIRINDEFDETSGDADIKLEATNDITLEDIEDNVLEFLPGGGEIEFRADVDGDGVGVVEMLDNEADVGGDPNTFTNGADTIKTNGRNLTFAGAEIILGNIDTSWLPVYSGGELLAAIDVDEGGAIPPELEDNSGLIPVESVDISDISNVENGINGEAIFTIDGELYYYASVGGQRYFIPIAKSIATFTFTVDGDIENVENLDVRFSVGHSAVRELEVTLESPQGNQVTLFANDSIYESNFQDTLLDDDASQSINSGNSSFNGIYRPQESLANFNGENPNGTWILRVNDTLPAYFRDIAESLYNDGTLYRAGDAAPWGTAIGTQLLLRNPIFRSGGSGSGSGGAINLEATHGSISAGKIRSFSETGDGGIVDLKAHNNIITGVINSRSREGIGGDINLSAVSGNILTYSLETNSFLGGGDIIINAGGKIETQGTLDTTSRGNGGDITLTAEEDITLESVNSNSSYRENSGNGGDINLTTEGDINTGTLNSSSFSGEGNSGDGGDINLTAQGEIKTAQLNSSSSSHHWNGDNSGNGGNINLTAQGDINAESLNSSSRSGKGNSGNGGDITITTESNINTEWFRSFSNSDEGNSENGGDITITAGGDINTQFLDSSSSESGNGGDINLTAQGNINTGTLNSSDTGGNRGDINLTAEGDINTGTLNSSSWYEGESGGAGHINLTAEGDINTETLNSSFLGTDNNLGNGGDITITAGGELNTGGIDSSSWAENLGNGGDITITAGGELNTGWISSPSYTSGGNPGDGGDITISSDGSINIPGINSFSTNPSAANSGDGGVISLTARESITTSSINSTSYSSEGKSGNGGAIFLDADTIRFSTLSPDSQPAISTFSIGENESGNGGNVNIVTNNLINTEILTRSSHANSGDVTIESQSGENLRLKNLSIITDKQVSIELESPFQEETIEINVNVGEEGQSGDVSIISSGNVNLNNVNIDSNTKGKAPAGNVNISSFGRIIFNNSNIVSTTSGEGNAGNIILETPQRIRLTNNSQLIANTEGEGNAGKINIQADTLNLEQNTNLTTETSAGGSPGAITIRANTVNIGQDAQISATVTKDSTNTEGGGDISINTNQLNITGKLGIFAETEATANAGTLTLEPYKTNPNLDITFSNDGFISASTSSTGNGGNINISAPESINIRGDGNISVQTTNIGNAGIINIDTRNLTLSDKVAISASTEDKGNAGVININTRNLTLETGTSLTTETNNQGQAGNIEINTRRLTIGENAQISATAREGATNTKAGGNITINATDLLISGRLGIFAETAGESPAGTLSLNPYRNNPNLNITFTQQGFISARTTSIGDGGNINIFSPKNINITGDGKISVETQGAGNAGTINIETQNLTLAEGVAISAETNSLGTAGNIEITSKQLTLGENTSISATAQQNATTTEAGGNITINTNDLQISGILGIFAETTGDSPAGSINIKPYQTDQNLNITFTENGFISARTFSTGDGGNINIFAPENINISGEGRITVETQGAGNAGIINIETKNLTIAENTTISAATSNSGDGGSININPNQTFQLEGQIITETTGTGNGGIITINTGEMNAPNSTISAQSTNAGNAGEINISAENNITTGIITSEANNTTETADGGNISIISEQGEINATQPIQSFSEGGNAGDVTLNAQNDITTNTISSHGQQEGGQITITSETGNIDASTRNDSFLANYSGGGNGGNVTIEAPQGNITTNDIYSFADGDGGQISIKAGNNINITENSNIISASEPPEKDGERGSAGVGRGGDLILEAGNNINTTNAKIYSGADIGDTGKIDIIGDGAIETGKIDLASGFQRSEQISVNNNFTLIPLPQGKATQGVAGDITLRSNNSTIDTTAGTINSRSPDGTGNITLNARENIATGKLEASALNEGKPTRGGDVNIISQQGEINATQEIETFSAQGTAGNVNIMAEGSVQLENILSQGTQRGGNITIDSRSENSINAEGTLNTFSDAGIAGDVTLTSPGNITISGIRSQGMEQGGEIIVNSEIGNIDSTNGNIDSFSEQGIGGDVTLTAPESVNLANVSSYGMTESGDLIIQSRTAQVNTGNVTTQAPAGNSGSIVINGTEVGTGDLSSIGTTSAGEINVEATDGSITTYDIEISSDGTIGDLILRATEDVTTEDINQNAGEEDANTNIDSGEDLNTGDINQNAENDANLNQTAGDDINTGNINQNARNNTNNIQTAGDDINTGNIDQNAGNNTNNIQTAGDDINTGNIDQNAGNNTNNIQTAGDDINTGNINQNAGNDTNNIQTAGGDINTPIINQNAGNDTNNIQTAGGDINTPVINQNAGNDTNLNQNAGGDINTPVINQNPGNNNNLNPTTEVTINTPVINQNTGNESINLHNEGINQNTDNTSVISNNNSIIQPIINQNNPQNNQTNTLNNPTNNTTINPVENNILSTTITSDIISTTTPSNNNQTINTATAKEQTDESINNTTDTQQILKTIDTVNTNPLTVATGSDQIVTMLEENRIKEYSDYFEEDFNEKLVNTQNVRDILTDMANQTGKESAVVYINAYADQIQIILFTKDGQPILKTIPTVNRDKLLKNAMIFSAEIIDFRNRNTTSYLPLAQKLYNWLIAPISDELEAANIDTILFSMDRGFRLLPVAALHDGEQFLIEKYSMSLIPSVSLMDSRYNSVKNTKLLGMGASEFIDETPLPSVPIELQTISEKLWQGNIFLNEEFTKNNLMNQLENRLYPIVHLATHAEFKAGKANDSYIHLWNDKLRLDEVRKLRWNSEKAELLVLSACRTAVGDSNAELGFAGLAIATGVKSALGSFWLVSDEGTLGLMTEFYSHLSNVKIKAEALREAQLAMLRGEVAIADGILRSSGSRGEVSLPPELENIQNKDFAHPYYWAGFTMVGSPW